MGRSGTTRSRLQNKGLSLPDQVNAIKIIRLRPVRGIGREEQVKSSFYLKHDLDAREDDRIRALIMKKGAAGYGIYWMICEDLYRSSGRLVRDYPALAWAYHEPEKEIKIVVEDFDLFYDVKGKIACRRVDRAFQERADASEIARKAGVASGVKRANGRSTTVQRPFNSRSTEPQPGEERRGEERKEITNAPEAFDFSNHRLKCGVPGGFKDVHVLNLSVEDCRKAIATARPNRLDLAALEWRIAEKALDRSGMSKTPKAERVRA